ncbi:MAG: hypothetical protein JWQ49_3803 [Edaphobacter sp.]|nr:hypothetical protein [Edaphobacter sp.]
MEVFNFVARLASAVTDFGALETLRNVYRNLNKRCLCLSSAELQAFHPK